MSSRSALITVLFSIGLGGCIHTPWAAHRIHVAEQQVLEAPDSAAGWMALGDAFKRAHSPRKARQAYQKALALDPGLPGAHAAIADIQPRHRIRRLEKRALRDPGNDKIWGDAADALLESGDEVKALRFYIHALRIDPHDEEWINRVLALGGQETMLELYREQMQAHPESDEIMGDYGDLLHNMEREEEACLAWQRAQQLDPGDSEWNDKVAGCVTGGDSSRAAASLLDALRARARENPEDDEVQGTLGDTLLAAGRNEEAIEAYRRALELDPGDSEWLDKLVAISGQPKLQILLDLSERFPTHDELWGNLGDIYLALGQREDARAAYRKAAALDPSDDEWTQKLRMFGTKEGAKGGQEPGVIPEVNEE
ncbi:MAG: tetratricopeptide repeat protein [Pseudomonadota bacterium]